MTAVLRWAAGWRYVIALVGTAAAFLAGAIVSAATDRLWQSDVAIVVGTGSGPLRPGSDGATAQLAERLDDLVRSNQIAGNVVSTLHLHESPDALLDRISVSVPEAGVLRIRVRDDSGVRATQVAQEIAFLFPQLLSHRFPRLQADIWDPPHLVGRTSARWGRNLAIAAAVSAVLWALALAVGIRARPRRPVPAAVASAPVVQPNLAAPPPSARSASPPEPPAPAVAASPVPVEALPPRPPEPVTPHPPPAPVAAPSPTAAPAGLPGEWTVDELERAIRDHGADFPDRVDEWGFYIESLREVAEPDGRLPATVDWLVWDTFGDVLDRARTERSRQPASESSPGHG